MHRLSRRFSSPLHTLAIRQAAKQTDEVNREMLPCVFWDVTATDAMLTPALDTLWQPTVSTQPAPLWLILKKKKKRRQGGSGEWHCAHDHTQDNVCQQQQQCHYVRETKTDNRGWFHGALTLHVQSSKDYHTSRRDPSSIGFNLFVFYPEAELWPLHTTEAKFILFKWKFNFFPPFNCISTFGTQSGRLKALHAG